MAVTVRSGHSCNVKPFLLTTSSAEYYTQGVALIFVGLVRFPELIQPVAECVYISLPDAGLGLHSHPPGPTSWPAH